MLRPEATHTFTDWAKVAAQHIFSNDEDKLTENMMTGFNKYLTSKFSYTS